MIIQDTIFIQDFGNITFEFNDRGYLNTFKHSIDLNAEFIIAIVSLDCNLTSNIIYHHCTPGYSSWHYTRQINFLKNLSKINHPGFRMEIYDRFFENKLFEKNYHFTKKFKCINLNSVRSDLCYDPYYTFFYDEYFLKNFTIKDDDVVYDLGANLGTFSIACSNYDVKKIYAFEPNDTSFKLLQKNCELYSKNTTCFQKAISDSFKTVILGGEEKGSIGHKILDENEREVSNKLECNAINLEQFVYENNLELPTYLKVDIEGSEYDFFNNTSDNFFKNTHCIFLEFHNNDGINVKKIIDRFINLNYKLTCDEFALDFQKSHMNTLYLLK